MNELDYESSLWKLGGCSGKMITTDDGYYGDGFIADVDTLENAHRIVACVNACAGMPISDIEELANIGNGVMRLVVQADDYRAERNEFHAAEMAWERAMMAAIGEDGIKSVSDAIAKLKADRKTLLDSMSGLVRVISSLRGFDTMTGDEARGEIIKAETILRNI